MSNKFPSRDSLSAMSVARLRLVDVYDAEDEVLLQEILDSKLANLPPENVVLNRGTDNTDFKNVDEEKAFQAKIDARVVKGRPKAKKVVEEKLPETVKEILDLPVKVKKTK